MIILPSSVDDRNPNASGHAPAPPRTHATGDRDAAGFRGTTTLENCVLFRATVFPQRWFVGFVFIDAGARRIATVDGNPVELAAILCWVVAENRILTGYHSFEYDSHIIKCILSGRDPHELSAQLIAQTDTESHRPPPRPVSLGCDHIDLAMRLRAHGRSPSLTSVAANLGLPYLYDVPFPTDMVLADHQWKLVKALSLIALWQMGDILEHLLPEIQAIETLAPEAGRDLRSVSKPRIVEYLFAEHFRQQTGSRPVPLPPPQEFTYQPVAGVRRPTTPEAAAWFDELTSQPMKVEGGHVRVPPRKFPIGGTWLSAGGGGIHSQGSPQLYVSIKKRKIVYLDVASFYATLIAKKGITPRAYGQHGQQIFAEILERRLRFKQRIDQAATEEEREYLQRQSDALKLVLNSSFGNLGNRFSSLYDPAAMTTITVTGQLMLIDLIERLLATGARILLANTDGIFVVVDAQDQSWRLAADGWQADTGMTLDIVPVQRLAVRNVNNYAVKFRRGKYKRVGVFRGSLDPQHVPNLLIINDAVTMALLEDVPPEVTICRPGTSMVRFSGLIRQTVATGRLVLKEGSKETPLPTLIRWFRSDKNKNRILWNGGARRFGEVENITLANDLFSRNPDSAADENLGGVDTQWYIKRARAELQKIRTPRALARKLARRSPLAAAVDACGMYPVPKWGGKNQPTGADAQRPSPHWNWEDYETVGIYTGRETATLVVDIDEPAKFAAWAFGGESPQLVKRHQDLDGCLLTVRGQHTAEQVRRGQAPGKLIFRCKLPRDHPLNGITAGHWRKSRGVDVFYGNDVPSVLGAYSDPTEPHYRLEGELTDAPDWLVRGLSPRNSGSMGQDAQSINVPPDLDSLPHVLGSLRPELTPAAMTWRRKQTDDHTILVGRCPYPHESGSTNRGDVSLGYDSAGQPYFRCLHASCTESKEVDRLLKDWHRQKVAEAVPEPDLTLTPIARAIFDDLEAKRVACHSAAQGRGKSYAAVQVAVARYRSDLCTCLSYPTIRLCEEARALLEQLAPDAIAAGAVAAVFGQRPRVDETSVEQDGELFGVYEIPRQARIIICTHAQLDRRGYSSFLRALWAHLRALGPNAEEKEAGRPAFAIIVDEIGELVRHQHRELPLAHRYTSKSHPDGQGGRQIFLTDCPKKNHSGNCANCTLEQIGVECGFNPGLALRELRHPAPIEVDGDGKRLREYVNPLTPPIDAFELGPLRRVGTTTFACEVRGYKNRSIDPRRLPMGLIRLFKPDPVSHKHPTEDPEVVFSHMLDFAYRPVMTLELPIDATTGAIADITQNPDAGVIFPWATCSVPRLRWTDLMVLEQMRQFAEKQKVGIVLLGPELSTDENDTLRTIWPGMVERQHAGQERKIKQVAVVFVNRYCGQGALITREGRLVTSPLEAAGPGIIFTPTKEMTLQIYQRVSRKEPALRAAIENDFRSESLCTLHGSTEPKTFLSYSRSVLGTGTNLLDIRFLVVHANAFRHIGGFTPGQITPEAFEKARADEVAGLILQNVGRALRGEPGKTVVIFVLNAEGPLIDAIKAAPAITGGSELPPVIATGDHIPTLVDQAGRWLVAGGGDWPAQDPTRSPKKRKGGRPKTQTKDKLRQKAKSAAQSGLTWREFMNRTRPQRILSADELEDLRQEFERECRQNHLI
jgi:hypothetical protein